MKSRRKIRILKERARGNIVQLSNFNLDFFLLLQHVKYHNEANEKVKCHVMQHSLSYFGFFGVGNGEKWWATGSFEGSVAVFGFFSPFHGS